MGKAAKVTTTVASTVGALGACAAFGWLVLLGGGLVMLVSLLWLAWVVGDPRRTVHLCMVIYGPTSSAAELISKELGLWSGVSGDAKSEDC